MTTIRECIVNAAAILEQREDVVARVQTPNDPHEQEADEMILRAHVWVDQAMGIEPTTFEEAKDLLACVAWAETVPAPNECHTDFEKILAARYHPGERFEAIVRTEGTDHA